MAGSLALIAGALINIYAGIAVMGTLGLDAWSINIIAVMMLICHNLLVESAVQSRTGVSGIAMTVFRIVAAIGMGICLSLLLPESMKGTGMLMGAAVSPDTQTLAEVMATWFMQTSDLTVKVILIIAVIGPNLTNTIVAVTIVGLPFYVRLVRASAISELTKDYVTAAKVAGVGPLRLMLSTVLPNCLAPLIVQAALGISDAILAAAGLGFLGLGAQPPPPAWGSMLADSRDLITSNPWVMAMPGIAILITVLAINLMGDGLRDALDPRLKKS